MAQIEFAGRKLLVDRLIPFGFVQGDGRYQYRVLLSDGALQLEVTIPETGPMESRITDADSGEEFVLHLVPSAKGAFVGRVREQYQAVLDAIRDSCTETDVFKSPIAGRLMEYVRQTYGDELEYLWPKFPSNAVWRRKDSRKWYAAILTVSRRKLGQNSDETVEIIDLRMTPGEKAALVDGVRYLPGYHMNKNSWYTICLDGSVPAQEICQRIDASYLLAKK